MADSERLLSEAETLLAKADAVSGRVIALERLAEVALSGGRNWEAKRLITRAETTATASWLSPHLLIRLKGLSVKAASSPEAALEIIREGDRLLTLHSYGCQPCSIGFRIAFATALAEMVELDEVEWRLEEAERIAAMWRGGPWAAAVWEARGAHRLAQGNGTRAIAAFEEAASRYVALGRPVDEARCMTRIEASRRIN